MEYTINSIAGYELEKSKLKEIISMFKNYEEYKKKGVFLSKGLIISGPPGVGKTLFAKVLANELNAPFYYLDGAKMDNFWGIRKINKIFNKAYKNAPAVIFIDELNSFIGDYDYESDYTKRNLSALLKLIDGIDKKEGVFVIGASSDKDDLDDAILRSGRMDKHICLSNPDLESRIKIFNYYLNKVAIDVDNIDTEYIMKIGKKLNGADIKTLVNEAALEALYKNSPLNNDILISNVRKIVNMDLDREAANPDLAYYAYHDIAHLIVSREINLKYNDISIRYNDMLGNTSIKYIYSVENNTEYTKELFVDSLSKTDILNNTAVLLASRAYEEVMLKDFYFKCSDDIYLASQLIYSGLTNGLFGLEYAHIEYLAERFKVSMDTMNQLENKKNEILNQQYNIALEIIKKYYDKIEILHDRLMTKKRLNRDDIEEILG